MPRSGMTPGSMPPFATNLEQEGVVFAPTYIQKNGKSNWPMIRKVTICYLPYQGCICQHT
ncbi:MAG: hydantoinase B/oxoprolinase family protein [Saprospiraceae bacterium]|nr:hydantoinase B/oxoprolinase family protein [Saprospiraceae bacterium]